MGNIFTEYQPSSPNTKNCQSDADCMAAQGRYPAVTPGSPAAKARCCLTVELKERGTTNYDLGLIESNCQLLGWPRVPGYPTRTCQNDYPRLFKTLGLNYDKETYIYYQRTQTAGN